MTLQDNLADVYRTLRYPASPKTATVTRLTGYLNTRHREILALPGMQQFRTNPLTLTTTANQAVYSLPPIVAQVIDIYDSVTNQRKLTKLTLDWLRSADPRAASQTGTIAGWIPLSYLATQQKPATNTALWVVSTSANDSAANVSVTVEYIRSGGIFGTATANANGVGAIQLGTDADILDITKFYTSANLVGTASLKANSTTGTVYSTITPGQSFARYIGIQLWQTPAANVSLNLDCLREIPDAAANPRDESLLPHDFQWLLTVGVLIDEYEHLNDSERQAIAQRRYNTGIANLKTYVNGSAIIIPGGPHVQRSSLQGNFPAGS